MDCPMPPHNVDTADYKEFIGTLRRILIAHFDNQRLHVRDLRDRRNIRHVPVLPRQRHAREPQRWINIKLVLNDGAETTLIVRDDNVYLIGFKNKRGELFEFGFSGKIDPRKRSRRMLVGSTFLECDVNYGSLLHGGGARKFVGMPLGRQIARNAVTRLSGYSHGPRGIADDCDTRCALAGLMVMVCEAARMRPLLEGAGWQAELRCFGIERKHVYYIWGWGDMSEALLRWESALGAFQFPECLEEIGVGGAGKAFDIVELLLNTPIHRAPRWRLDQRPQRPAAGDDDDDRRSEQQRRAAGDDRGRSENQRPTAGEHGSGSGSSGQQQQSPPNKRRRTEQQHDQDQQPPPPPPPPSDKGSGESQHSHQQKTPVSPADDYVARGRPLVEVFLVRAGFHFVGTISVFDGMRGQVIYENSDGGAAPIPIHGSSSRSGGDDDQGYETLLLTGPYRAISAYGSFTIEVVVDITGAVMAPAQQADQGAGPNTDVGELNWDCYDEEKVYDRPVIETITTSSGREVEVTYAVLSNAVDAELDVHLRLPGATAAEGRGAVVYGRIATRSKDFHDDEDQAWSVLFDSQVEGVSLVADGPGSNIPRLPLARSVVAMPLGSPLVIMATLYDAPPSQHGVNPVFQCQDMEVTLDGDCKMTRFFADNGGEFEVSITSPDYYPRPRRTRQMSTDHYAGCY